MENVVPLSFVTWLLGSLIVLLGGCFSIFKYFETKLNRVYERMDENKALYYKEFVSQKVYESEKESKKESIDLRFVNVVSIFTEKIDSIRSELRVFVAASTAAATAAAMAAAENKKIEPYTRN